MSASGTVAWFMIPGNVFDHPGLCAPQNGDGKNLHFKWEHQQSTLPLSAQ